MTTTIPEGARVQVYWNLHKHCYSVVALEGPAKGRVVAHVSSLNLADATFTVQPAGREKVRREQRKTVHAFVRGRWTSDVQSDVDADWDTVTYNPYRHDTFVTVSDESPIAGAKLVVGVTSVAGRPSIVALAN